MNPHVTAYAAIVLLPLLAAAVCLCLPASRRAWAATIAVTAMAVSFAGSMAVLIRWLSGMTVHARQWNFDWIALPADPIRLGLLLDPYTILMLTMVTGVGLLIFVFAGGYMHGDPRRGGFFCSMSFFAAAMLGMVMSNSMLLLLICWELMGLASYLLIGFWFQKPEAAAAARKAFITTRIGDLGLLAATVWLSNQCGTLLFYDNGNGLLEAKNLDLLMQAGMWAGMGFVFWIALLAFWGAVGKSGQFPLHVWLPDAMEGPTPVSALIHAATMVAAGVFLMVRLYPLLVLEPVLLGIIASVGAFTALFAACIALAQRDIKRILAYSTVSQLGLMMLGLGVGGPAVAMFHLFTHAIFKALLFLAAGSVIHGTHHEQDIFKMGGLKKAMPVTCLAWGAGYLALAGIPPLAGFWSKDEIVYYAFKASPYLFAMAWATSLLTAFYTTRQFLLVFFGKYRGHHAPHESPRVMTVPLLILAAGAILAGLLGTPWKNLFAHFLEPGEIHDATGLNVVIMLVSFLTAITGIVLGWFLYGRHPEAAAAQDPLQRIGGRLYRTLADRLYVDEFYAATFGRLILALSQLAATVELVLEFLNRLLAGIAFGISWAAQKVGDQWMINGGFDFLCDRVRQKGAFFAALQTGKISISLRLMAGGVALLGLLLWMLH
ncbi:MAG: NADH-quinone oxidoreductase subunit L [Verrucomicrobiae bacterium]|nr:NADH-quinone oxidoreductase subunit L [Verrucomicrobiae bacterium]